MAVAYALKSGSKNSVNIYDKDLSTTGWNRIELTKDISCQKIVVDIDAVSICDNTTTFPFNLTCIPKGNYKLEFFQTGQNVPTYSLPAIVY